MIGLLVVGRRKGEICDHAHLIYVQSYLLSWEMAESPRNKHKTLAFNASLSKALPLLKGGKIAWSNQPLDAHLYHK